MNSVKTIIFPIRNDKKKINKLIRIVTDHFTSKRRLLILTENDKAASNSPFSTIYEFEDLSNPSKKAILSSKIKYNRDQNISIASL